MPNLRVDQVLKLFTTVPPKFIDDFYALYDRKRRSTTDFIINLDALSTWLEVNKTKLTETLRKSYTLNVDYTVASARVVRTSKYGGNNYKKIMLTSDCMKRLCMRSRSDKAETVRTYFIKIEHFLSQYNDEIVDGLMREIHEDARRNIAEKRKDGPGIVYVLRAAENPTPFLDYIDAADLNKLGETGQTMAQRLRTYNTGRAKDAEVLTVYKAPYRKEVEMCVKKLMHKKRFIKRREIYEVDNEIITKLIEGCDRMSMKLHYVTRKSKLTGPYYIIFTSDASAAAT